jgi:hypothetical protein
MSSDEEADLMDTTVSHKTSRNIKGRGKTSALPNDDRYTGKGGEFESLDSDAKEGEPVKCLSLVFHLNEDLSLI